MLQDHASSQEAAERFLRRVRDSRAAWGLRNPHGDWAVVPSNQSQNARVIPFWSDRPYAMRCAKAEWADYQPTQISLAVFLEAWLPGMCSDGLLVGLNWEPNLCGVEMTATEVLRRLTASS